MVKRWGTWTKSSPSALLVETSVLSLSDPRIPAKVGPPCVPHRRIALEAKMPVRNSRNDAQYAPQNSWDLNDLDVAQGLLIK
jgi:hypothetical protein